jgi:hypothetical protein
MRYALVVTVAALVVAAVGCGGPARYAGLTRSEATRLALRKIEAQIDPSKRRYYEISIWNVTAGRGETDAGAAAWLVGFWNGQSETAECALASRTEGNDRVRLIPCAAFPKFARG